MNFLANKTYSIISISIYFLTLMSYKNMDVKILMTGMIGIQLLIVKYKPQRMEVSLVVYLLMSFIIYGTFIAKVVGSYGR
jgi:hypothetical protein